MQKLFISLLLISTLFIYFGCQEVTPTDPATKLDKPGSKWYVPGDFVTIQEAIDDAEVMPGDIIMVSPGNHLGAFVDKSLTIKGEEGVVINGGPAHGSGLIMGFRLRAGSDGSKISHLTFTTDLSIMNGAAVNDVTVTQCTFLNSIQAISNWTGKGWNISHNKITDLRTKDGGGIGILVADWSGGSVSENVVSHNTISGTLYVDPNDGGGYAGSGIVIYADFRWGWAGASAITNNSVTYNSRSVVSDNPTVVDINAFELTESYYPNAHPGLPYVVIGNSIGFNDFRGTTNQILLSPGDLEGVNTISRNLGDNRGQGLHPSVFNP